ncbi:uncharacterized protein LOC116547628 [Sapajus apella]|uniref:Uncharacterized protein LOC116547628 n=1 Tax=Sapajus apella TaxID=9515 RepID=A0A6J3HH37_SAPAP|nr:uncharacterized protein LOC116547628 [Sapajus apella]
MGAARLAASRGLRAAGGTWLYDLAASALHSPCLRLCDLTAVEDRRGLKPAAAAAPCPAASRALQWRHPIRFGLDWRASPRQRQWEGSRGQAPRTHLGKFRKVLTVREQGSYVGHGRKRDQHHDDVCPQPTSSEPGLCLASKSSTGPCRAPSSSQNHPFLSDSPTYP